MGGGRTAEGVTIYRRVNGKYVRQVPYKTNSITEIIIESKIVLPKDTFHDKFKKAKTKKELRTVLQEKFAVSNSFIDENNIEMSKRVVNTIIELEEKYPFMEGYVKGLAITNGGLASLSEKGVLYINPEYWSVLNHKSLFSGKQRMWHPPNQTPESIIAHEFGHALLNHFNDRILEIAKNYPDETKRYGTKIDVEYGRYSKLLEARVMQAMGYKEYNDKNLESLRAQVCLQARDATKVGSVPVNEAFAEAFADVYANGQKASKASQTYVDVLLEYIEKLGG